MDRKIDLNPWTSISFQTKYDFHTLNKIATFILENNNNEYCYIQDDIEKIRDVSSMPDYIRQDWINYNKKELTEQVLDVQIKDLQEEIDTQWPPNDSLVQTMDRLKSLRRDLRIKNIL